MHTFTANDFPNQRLLMESENLTQLQITYRQQGEKQLLDKFRQTDDLQLQLTRMGQRLQAIQSELTAMQAQEAAQNVALAAAGSKIEQGLAGIRPPNNIAWCWSPPRAEKATAPSNAAKPHVAQPTRQR